MIFEASLDPAEGMLHREAVGGVLPDGDYIAIVNSGAQALSSAELGALDGNGDGGQIKLDVPRNEAGALVLLHNLYAGAAASSREILRWSTIALAGVFAFDLNLFTIAYLGGEYPMFLLALRGVFGGVMVCLVAMSANAKSAGIQFRPSRAVTFQTLSLLVIGSYLLLMVLVTRSLALLGGFVFARIALLLARVRTAQDGADTRD